jgi:hypothetical protein
VQRAGECLGAKGTEDPQGGRKGQHPLLDWHGLAHTTVGRYRDLLVDAMLLRSLPPVLPNVGKRLTKSPKVYVRDSGLLHALLGAETHDALLGAIPCWARCVRAATSPCRPSSRRRRARRRPLP